MHARVHTVASRQYLLALLSPDYQQSGVRLASDRRALRITHVSEDKLCIWRPKLETLKALSMPSSSQDPLPAVLIQVLDAGEAEWLEKDVHNYAHLLRVAIPRNPAFLAVKATLKDLAAYSADFVPPEALDELTSYLLSWAATVAPFDMLSAEQLRLAAANDNGALQAAHALVRQQRSADLTQTSARAVLVQTLCEAITRSVKHSQEALLVGGIGWLLQDYMSALLL